MKKLYFGGPIYTMAEQGSRPYALLTEDDTIAAVLYTREEAEAVADAQPIDLKGRTLLPAFIDPHSHFSGYCMSLLQIRLTDCTTRAQVLDKIKDRIAAEQPEKDKWLTASGYDHTAFADGQHITKEELDTVSPDNPLVVKHISGHLGILNSRALEMLGVDAHTPVPQGGVMEQKEGKLTGYMEENAFIDCIRRIPMAGFEDILKVFKKGQRDYYSYGITLAQEGNFPVELIPVYQAALGHAGLGIDLVGYTEQAAFAPVSEQLGGKFPNFSVGGYKIFLDGSPQARTAWMKQPYVGEARYNGYGVMTDEQVYAAVKRAALDGQQILAHCNGDMAAQQLIDAVERVEKEGIDVAAVRPVMVHAQLLEPHLMPKMRELGIIPSFFVAHVYHWGEIHAGNFGEARASQISPVAAAQKEGIPYTFHQDSPVIAPNMMETLWCAANRVTKKGRVLGADMAVPVYDAVTAVTKNAAHQYFMEETRGTLEPGKKADLILLDQDPMTADKMALREIKVLQTIKNGEVVFER